MELTTILMAVGIFVLGYIIGCAQRLFTKLSFYQQGVDYGAKATHMVYQQQLSALGVQMQGAEGMPTQEEEEPSKDNTQAFGFDLTTPTPKKTEDEE